MKQISLTYPEIIHAFQGKNVLVIGDFILDVYLKGVSTRLCPEAPVPVVDVSERVLLLGGAANTMCNLRAMGASVNYCTVIGLDNHGDEALHLIESIGVKTSLIYKAPERRTVTKTRIISNNHVVSRFDEGDIDALDAATEEILIQHITQAYEFCDAVLISDYDKGLIGENLLAALIRLQARWPKFVAVDSKRLSFFARLHPYLAKPNYDEVVKLLNLQHQYIGRVEQVSAVTSELYDKINADIIAITLDAEGSVIVECGQPVHRCKATTVENPHVSGAGDTYLSAFMLAYICSVDVKKSAEIANAAASIAVKKEYTSSCTGAELRNHFNVQYKHITSWEDLKIICDAYRTQGKRIVFTNGCFDILHSGHVTYLHCAKELGDVLIVGLNSDESIKRLKGETRPINTLMDRMQVLSGLTAVDHVFAFGDEKDDTPIPVIKVVQPHVFAKGGDYTKEKLPEAATVEEGGGEIIFLPHIPDHSTTSIIRRISSSATSDQALTTLQ